MVQLKFSPMHDDKNAQKLMDQIAKIKVAHEKKQSHEASSQGGSRGTQQNLLGKTRDS